MIDGAKGNRSRIQLWERIFIWARSAAFHLRCEPTPQSGHRRQLRRRLAWRSRHGDWANATARLRASPPPGHRSQPSRRFLRPAGDEQTWPALTLDDEAGSPASSPHPAERRRRAPEQPAPMPSAPAPRLSAPRPTRSATRGVPRFRCFGPQIRPGLQRQENPRPRRRSARRFSPPRNSRARSVWPSPRRPRRAGASAARGKLAPPAAAAA